MSTKEEMSSLVQSLEKLLGIDDLEVLKLEIMGLMEKCEKKVSNSPQDFLNHVMESHKTLCRVKNMGMKDAYGQDPFLYYALGLCGEAGEIANKLVKGFRSGYDFGAAQEAVRSELPDVFIYGAILAYVADIDIFDEITKKVDIVVERALDGYYGGPLSGSNDPSR